VDVDRLRQHLTRRLVAPHPRFRSVVRGRGLPLVPPLWHPDPAFDLDRHLTRVRLDEHDAGDAALERLVGELFERPLDPAAAAPWQLVIVDGHRPSPGAAPRSVIVGRLHHALADGAALVRLLLDLADPAEPSERDGAAGLSAAHDAPARRRRGRPTGAGLAARLAVAVPVTTLRLLLMAPEPRTPLRGRLAVPKGAAWSEPRPLEQVKVAAARLDATVNDVLLAAVAGGLRRHLAGRGTARLPRRLRVYVPVDLSAGDSRLGNRFGLLPLRLPVAEPDPGTRVRTVAAATRAAKRSLVPPATFVLIGVLGVVPEVVRRLVVARLGSAATAVVTNVPGPRQPLTLAGTPIDGIAFWVPQAAAVGVGVSLFSYAGTVRIGVAADAGLVPDPQRLADDLDEALTELLRDTPSAGNPGEVPGV
jgi:WS/DGAT/MGAT family acyltransferase